MSQQIDANSWHYSPDHGQPCKVIETQTLWGETTCRVWLPGSDSVVRIFSKKAGIKRIGLKTVRNFRSSQIEQEEREWRKKIEEQSKASPGIVPLIIIRVNSEKKNG